MFSWCAAWSVDEYEEHAHRGAGAGAPAPGGEGIERDLQVLTDATVSLITERRVSQLWGLAGGEPGAVGENWLLPGGDESVPSGCPTSARSSSRPATSSGC